MPSRTGVALDFGNPLTRQAWQTAWLLLQSCASCDGLGAMLPGHAPGSPLTATVVARARAALPPLIVSAQQLDIRTSLSVALPLLGAGPGLTPSWDDLLVWFLCGLRLTCGSDEGRSRFIGQFGRTVSRESASTTAVSRMYIQRTVNGPGPAWIEEALAAIATGNQTRTYSATAQALRIGHTSGTDMMLGVILGSSVWQNGRDVDQVLSALSCQRFRI
jgi:hypothetical protein